MFDHVISWGRVPQRSMTVVAVRVLALTLVLAALALTAMKPASASASVASCQGGACTVYFSQSETRDLAQGRVPRIQAPPPIQAAAYAFVYGHRLFAAAYAEQGKCTYFRVSIDPRESQGYNGYSCDWQ